MGNKSRAFIFLTLIFCQHLQIFANEFTGGSPTDSTEKMKDAIEQLSETHEFQAEIGRLMDIIINSLYTNKEIFLREIISNASDALDKIRFLAIADPEALKELSELVIRVEYDPEAKTITVYDSGIGMTKHDLINNLGTIAKSGTTNFVQALAQGQSLNLIGQFGVGFYATFLAGNKVTVITKNNNDDQYIWESSAASSFTVRKDPEGNTLKRGTKIIIDLKSDSEEFCNENKLKELIQRYSEFINFPIYLRVQKEVSKEVADEDAEVSEEKPEKKDDLEIKDDDETPKPQTKTITEKVWDWELMNDNKAIWLRDKNDLTEEDYHNFYKALAKEYDDPLAYIHFKAEGEVDFKSIMFIPGHAPQNLYENYYAKVSTLKLYVRRVLINEKFEDLLPKYLNFIRGVIDSDDLPINVSRESLQQVKMLKLMGKRLVKKALEMIKNLADPNIEEDSDEEDEDTDTSDNEQTTQQDQTKTNEERDKKRKEKIEKYNRFWTEFGKNIKLGIIEDASNRNKLVQLTRWYTSKSINELSSLDDYIKRMKPIQEHIYYIGGENKEVLLKNPSIQSLLKGGYEVILLDDPIDEFCLQNVYDYGEDEGDKKNKRMLINVGKGSFPMPTDDETQKKVIKKLKKIYEPLTDWWKNLLKDKLEVVTISERLVEDPCVVVGSVYGYSATMERISKAQAYGPSNPMASSKRNLEVNPGHPVIKELLHRVKNNPDKDTEEMATLLYEAALLNSGFALSDPSEFAAKFFKIFSPAMGISKDARVEDLEVDLDDEDDANDDDTITPISGTPGEGVRETIDSNSIKIEFDDPRDKGKKGSETRETNIGGKKPNIVNDEL